MVALLGTGDAPAHSLSGSEYLKLVHNTVMGALSIDLEFEKRVQRCCIDAIRRGIINSAHDCSDGGLAITLTECCLYKGIGFRGEGWQFKGRLDATLFGEVQSRIIVSVRPDKVKYLEQIAAASKVPVTKLGVVGGKQFTIEGCIDLPLEQLESIWRGSLKNTLG